MLVKCGKISSVPYYIDALDINVYSLEELNYFVFNHVNLVYREFFCGELYSYIENELERGDISAELRRLEAAGTTIQELILTFFGKSGYYRAEDMQRIAPLLADIDVMSRQQRLVIEADSYFKAGRLDSALRIYHDILRQQDESGEDSSFFARIAFSIGVIYAKLFMSKNANSYFEKAYELYPDPTYAKASVYMSIINEDDEELLRTIIRYKVSDEALEAIKRRILSMEREIEREPRTKEFTSRFESASDAEKEDVLLGWKDDYYRMRS